MSEQQSNPQECEHTPTPWFLDGDDITAEHLDGTIIAQTCGGNYFCEINKKANARRIIACVNACEGFSTESLELPELKQPTNVLDSMLRRNVLIIANARRLIRDKRMSNSRLYAELFGTGMGIAIKRCDEMGLCPESNKTSYSEMINEIDAQVQAQSCAAAEKAK